MDNKEFQERKDAILKKIEQFKYLKENWNGYGAEVFNIEFLDRCKKFISRFKDSYIEGLEVFPLPDGGIQLEWGNKNSRDNDNDKIIEYLEIKVKSREDEKCECLYSIQHEDCREEFREFRVQNSNAGIKRVIEKFKSGEYLEEYSSRKDEQSESS